MKKIAVVGASGYSGEELVGLLLSHPEVDLAAITSRQNAGRTLAQVFPKFGHQRKAKNLRFTEPRPEWIAQEAEIVFLALRSYDFWGDENREWFARSAGWYGVAGIGWMVLTFLVFFGAYSLREFPHRAATLLPAGAVSGLTTLLLGQSS